MPASPVSDEIRRLVAAALPHVSFEGWSEQALEAAAAELGMSEIEVRAALPGGAVDLAAASHRIADEQMRARLAGMELDDMRLSAKVALALRLRLEEIPGREAARRAGALFALPNLAPRGAALVWGTADAIWDAVGDHSTDGNWYTKRVILAGVWTATVTYWLGDNSPGWEATHDFIDRRIAGVLRFEKAKAKLPVLTRLLAAIPAPVPRDDLPGRWAPEEDEAADG